MASPSKSQIAAATAALLVVGGYGAVAGPGTSLDLGGNGSVDVQTTTPIPTVTPSDTPAPTEEPAKTDTAQSTATPTPTPGPESAFQTTFNESDFKEEIESKGLTPMVFTSNASGYTLTYQPNESMADNHSKARDAVLDAWTKFQPDADGIGHGLYATVQTSERSTVRGQEVLAGTPTRTFDIRSEWTSAYNADHMTREEIDQRINASVRDVPLPDYSEWLDDGGSITEHNSSYTFTVKVTNGGEAALSANIWVRGSYGSNEVHYIHFEDTTVTLAPGESVTLEENVDKSFFEDEGEGPPIGAEMVTGDVVLA